MLNITSPELGRLMRLRDIVWGRVQEAMDRDRLSLNFYMVNPSCGTPGCIAGHCMVDEEFQRQGLGYNRAGLPAYGDLEGGRALDAFFGLTMPDTMVLFGSRHSAAFPTLREEVQARFDCLERIIEQRLEALAQAA